ncbi:peptidase M23 [Micromonospora sp. DT233]|uniref:peptidase M23 n=1 Tax=Micromonospora sp. DT233 TaxID=3393432 RepID=UPI003CF9710F
MRDDGTLDDRQSPDTAVGRSDVTPSSERPASPTAGGTRPECQRRPSLGDGSDTPTQRSTNLLDPTDSEVPDPADPAGRESSGDAAVRATPARRRGRAALALAAGLTCCLGLAALAQTRSETGGTERAAAAAGGADLAARAAAEAASRARNRTPAGTPSASPTGPTATPSPSATTAAPAAPRKPTQRARPVRSADPAPVAGLTRTQMANAKVIVQTGRKMGVPRRGLVIAVATAMQESNLYNVASGVLPESQNYPHQGVGWDHDSCGLFQQRTSSGWGEVGQLMDPEFATRQFLAALEEIPGWKELPLAVAAQAVQVSAYPDLYAQHEERATEVVEAFLPAT